jgi:hypothetical protein
VADLADACLALTLLNAAPALPHRPYRHVVRQLLLGCECQQRFGLLMDGLYLPPQLDKH